MGSTPAGRIRRAYSATVIGFQSSVFGRRFGDQQVSEQKASNGGVGRLNRGSSSFYGEGDKQNLE